MKAIIPAAGLGTRFLPGTKCTPKEMLPVLDKPVIQYVVEEALDPEEVDDAIIVTSPGKPELLNYFQPDRSLENLLRERGKDGYADAVAEAARNITAADDEPEGRNRKERRWFGKKKK